jgi:hypothetical protein
MSTSRILAVTAAVALAGALTAQAQQVSEKKATRNPKLITTEDVEAARSNNAYQVVEKLHPEWLRRVSHVQTLGGGRPTLPSSRGSDGGNDAGATAAIPSDENYIQPNQEVRQTAVFVDGTDMGGIEELAQVQSNMIQQIRFLNSSDAGAKYGPRYPAGVIEVMLKSR